MLFVFCHASTTCPSGFPTIPSYGLDYMHCSQSLTNPPTPRDDIWTSRLDVFVLVLAIEHLYDENLFLFVKIEFIYYDALLNVAFTMLDNQCSVA